MGYVFSAYWTGEQRIEFLQRVVLIHSFLYYELDHPIWSDAEYDEVSRQLVAEQKPMGKNWVRQHTRYGYVCYDFDGSTGMDLYRRLSKRDQEEIHQIAWMLAQRYGGKV